MTSKTLPALLGNGGAERKRCSIGERDGRCGNYVKYAFDWLVAVQFQAKSAFLLYSFSTVN